MHCHKMLLETAIHFSCNETEYTLILGQNCSFNHSYVFSSVAGQLKLRVKIKGQS